jgi:hypothetical protein
MRGGLLLVLATACGRVGFDAVALASGDAAVADAPPPCAGWLFCDGFEDPALSAWHGTQQNAGTTVERLAAFGRVGASLHTTGPVGTNVAAKYVDVFASTEADLWVRLYLYAKAGTVLDVEAVTLADPARMNEIAFSLYDDGADLHGHGIASDFEVTLMEAPLRDQWVCWEIHVAIGMLGSVELYREGTFVLGSPSLDTRPPAGNLSRLLVGVTSKPPTLEQELFVDDVAADESRVGCD